MAVLGTVSCKHAVNRGIGLAATGDPANVLVHSTVTNGEVPPVNYKCNPLHGVWAKLKKQGDCQSDSHIGFVEESAMAGRWNILYVSGSDWRDGLYLEGEVHEWSVHEDARNGDYGLIYAISPVKSFVAIAQLQDNAVQGVGEPRFHAKNQGWAEIEILHVFEERLEYQNFGHKAKLRAMWPLVKSQMQPSQGPERIPAAAIDFLTTLSPELDDFLHNPQNEHRRGRRFVWQIMDQGARPLKGKRFYEEQEAKDYLEQHRDHRGRPFWIKREIEGS